MRREVLFAIVIGIGLGAVVAFGVWRANLIIAPKVKEVMQTPTSGSDSSNTTIVNSSNLIITQPEDSTVVDRDKVTIKGSAAPNSTIILTSDADEQVTLADGDGTFEKEIGLSSGVNNVTVTSFDDHKNQSTQKITLVYSTEFPGTQ